MKIAFDLDNTCITQGDPETGYVGCDPIPEMISLVNELYDQGHEIYIFTARHFKYFRLTEETLKKYELKYHGLVMNKISCDLYVDDKGFRYSKNEGELKSLIKELSNV